MFASDNEDTALWQW